MEKEIQALRAAVQEMPESDDPDVNCQLCEDQKDHWVYCIETKGGSIIRGRRIIERASSVDRVDYFTDYAKQWVEKCSACMETARIRSLATKARTRDGNAVSLKMISERYSAKKDAGYEGKDPRALAKVVPSESTLLIGDTGGFKTMVMEFWYNKLLQDFSNRLIWIKESEIVKASYSDGGHAIIESMRNKTHVFINEAFTYECWIGANNMKDGYTQANLVMAFRDIWDYLYTNRQIIVLCDTNMPPESRIKNPDLDSLVRRIDEIFRDGRGRINV